MKKYFYSHLVEIDSIVLELDKLEMTSQERKHLIEIIDSSLYHTIIDAILSELQEEEDKKVFLLNSSSSDHEKVWKHLEKKIENIEEKIISASDKLKKDFFEDVKKISLSQK